MEPTPIMICDPELAAQMGVEVGTIIGETDGQRKYREWQERIAMLMRLDDEGASDGRE